MAKPCGRFYVFTDCSAFLAPFGGEDLVLDMKGVEYISSAGLRVLLVAQKKMGKIGTLTLTDVCDAVMDIFEMTGFSDILVIE